MVKYTKKGERVKNVSYKYGILGEFYVARYVHCPRCGAGLKQLTAGTPAMDFHCKGTRETHWFQLKSYQDTRLKLEGQKQGIWNIHCGQYTLQHSALFTSEHHADILVLRYQRKKHQVMSLHWYGNEKIKPQDLRVSRRNDKTYSRVNGGRQKQVTGTIVREHSILRIRCAGLVPLTISQSKLPLDFSYDLNERMMGGNKVKAPAWNFTVAGGYRVCLRDEKCSCRAVNDEECPHIDKAWEIFLENPNHRQYRGDRGKRYAVDVEEWTCSCPQYRYRSQKCICKHLQDASAKPAVPYQSPLVQHQMTTTSPSQKSSLCTWTVRFPLSDS